jgi:anti-sigma regulatory factor (Ser/Thr protein kinase)
MNSALRTSRLDRNQTAALDWAVNEITDNVLSHANSSVGGFLICSRVPRTNIIEFTVADAGIGVSRSLGITDDLEALEKAIQEGVTRNKTTNQGNGLFGTYRLSLMSKGLFVLKSKNGSLFVDRDGDMRVRRDPIPFPGTFVVCQIDCDDPNLIERALSFSGSVQSPPFDYIERKHEQGSESPIINAKDICKTFGSRSSGQEARNYIVNVLAASDTGKSIIDFSDIHVTSSSFADEVFGKLFVELGPMRFMRSIEVVNAVSTVSGLIDRAIMLRSKTGL